MLIALARNWWMMAVRGSLALAFGLVLLLSPVLQLDRVVGLFGAYAVLDGIWSLAASRRVSKSLVAAWPIALGAVVSIAIGILAIGWPFVPARVVQLLAGWGLIVGGLEVVAALMTSRATARHWLLGSGGVWTIFLAVTLMVLPHGDVDSVLRALGVYAIVFGLLVFFVASMFRRDMSKGTAALP